MEGSFSGGSMFLILATVGVFWSLLLLRSARRTLKTLPASSACVPSYALVLEHGAIEPILEPPPVLVHRGEVGRMGPDQLLYLDGGINVPKNLPARLAACSEPFVSVLPKPNAKLRSQLIERLTRQFARPSAVNSVRSSIAFADQRCAWLSRQHLDLPGPEAHPIMRAARALKAFGQPLALCEDQAVYMRSQEVSPWPVNADWFVPRPAFRWMLMVWWIFGNLSPFVALFHSPTRGLAMLVLSLAFWARVMTSFREGFGWRLSLAGFCLEPFAALRLWKMTPVGSHHTFPKFRMSEKGTTEDTLKPWMAWLDGSAVFYLARRFGASARVMAQIYNNVPQGDTAFGRCLDRCIHASAPIRAFRFRLFKTIALTRELKPGTLLSVPCGQARDTAVAGAHLSYLIDSESWALANIIDHKGQFTTVLGTVDDLPNQRFDLIIFIGLTEFLGDSELRRCLDVLKSRLGQDGAIILSFTCSNSTMIQLSRFFGWVNRDRSPEEMAELLENCGFRIERRASDSHHLQFVFQICPI